MVPYTLMGRGLIQESIQFIPLLSSGLKNIVSPGSQYKVIHTITESSLQTTYPPYATYLYTLLACPAANSTKCNNQYVM